MKIKRLPNILALHLKRFKYQESLGRYTKLFYRVPFPTSLRLPNTADDTVNPDRLYELFAVVVHIGNGPHHGHYVCLIRSSDRWVMCDDENVEPIEDSDIFRYFGDYPSGAGYVLFYQAVDLNPLDLGLKVAPKRKPPPKTAPEPTPDLHQIAETNEEPHNRQSVETSPRAPLSVTIPATQPTTVVQSPPPVATPAAAPAPPVLAPVATATPAKSPLSPVIPPSTNGLVTRQISGTKVS